jgi:hypothetical protein
MTKKTVSKVELFDGLKELMARQEDSLRDAPKVGDILTDDGPRKTGEFLVNISGRGGWKIADSVHLRVYRNGISEIGKDHYSEHSEVTSRTNYTLAKFRERYDSLTKTNQRLLADVIKRRLE